MELSLAASMLPAAPPAMSAGGPEGQVGLATPAPVLFLQMLEGNTIPVQAPAALPDPASAIIAPDPLAARDQDETADTPDTDPDAALFAGVLTMPILGTPIVPQAVPMGLPPLAQGAVDAATLPSGLAAATAPAISTATGPRPAGSVLPAPVMQPRPANAAGTVSVQPASTSDIVPVSAAPIQPSPGLVHQASGAPDHPVAVEVPRGKATRPETNLPEPPRAEPESSDHAVRPRAWKTRPIIEYAPGTAAEDGERVKPDGLRPLPTVAPAGASVVVPEAPVPVSGEARAAPAADSPPARAAAVPISVPVPDPASSAVQSPPDMAIEGQPAANEAPTSALAEAIAPTAATDRPASTLSPRPAHTGHAIRPSDPDRPALAAANQVPVADAPAMLSPAPVVQDAGLASTAPADPSVSMFTVSHQAIGVQLAVAQDGQWLDQLARDIARTAAQDGELRFHLNPEHLGSLAVEMRQTADGTALRLTADTEAARSLIADAQPRLLAEAKAQGVRIAEAHVDLGGGRADAQGRQPQQSSPQGHNPVRGTNIADENRSPVTVNTRLAAKSERYA